MIRKKSHLKINDQGSTMSMKGRFRAEKSLINSLRDKAEHEYSQNLDDEERHLYADIRSNRYDFFRNYSDKTREKVGFLREGSQEDLDEDYKSSYECTENSLEMNVSTGIFKAKIDRNGMLLMDITGTRDFVKKFYDLLRDEKKLPRM